MLLSVQASPRSVMGRCPKMLHCARRFIRIVSIVRVVAIDALSHRLRASLYDLVAAVQSLQEVAFAVPPATRAGSAVARLHDGVPLGSPGFAAPPSAALRLRVAARPQPLGSARDPVADAPGGGRDSGRLRATVFQRPQIEFLQARLLFTSVTNAVTNENQPTTAGLVITPDLGLLGGSLTISNITSGTLFQHDGVTPIHNGDSLSFGQGQAGLVFTPNANSIATGSFLVRSSSLLGLLGGSATANITVNPVPVNSVPSGTRSTSEDAPLVFSGSNQISVSDPGNPSGSAQVTLMAAHGTVTLAGGSGVSITSGTGTADASVTFSGTFGQINHALGGMQFTPSLHFTGSGASLSIQSAEGGNSANGAVAITVNPVAHTPSITSTATGQNQQSATGLVITPNALDSGLSGFYQIRNISNGKLYRSDGVTQISNSSFITFAQGAAGLKFTPDGDSPKNGSFDVRASTSNGPSGLGGGTASATILVSPIPVTSVPPAQTTNEDAPLTFSNTAHNAITVTDSAGGNATAQVALSAAHGTLTLATTSGISFSFWRQRLGCDDLQRDALCHQQRPQRPSIYAGPALRGVGGLRVSHRNRRGDQFRGVGRDQRSCGGAYAAGRQREHQREPDDDKRLGDHAQRA